MSDSVALIQSYVHHIPSARWFFVSTMDRESSAAVSPPNRYAETIVWSFDYETKKRGDILAMDEGIDGHGRQVYQFFRYGVPFDE